MNNNVSDIRILSMNVQGFGNANKRTAIISHIKRFKPNVICLSDTRLDTRGEINLLNEFQYYGYFSSLSSNARGVAILISKNFPIKVEKVQKDETGNWIILSCIFESKKINLANIYGPNNDDPQFFEVLFENLRKSDIPRNIICGDFNTTLDFNIDNSNYAAMRNNRARSTLNQLLLDYSYFDTFRHMQGDKKEFTWFRKGGEQKARLDLFLASENLRPNITESRIVPTLKSDHNPILLTLDFAKFVSGPGYWKFKDDLLKDEEYIKRIKCSISDTCAKYVTHDKYTNFFQECTNIELQKFREHESDALQKLEYNINPNLMLEMIQNDMKNVTISYSVNKNREDKTSEKEIFDKLQKVRENFQNNLASEIEFKNAEMEYESFMESKSQEEILKRSEIMKIEGEKPTRYFCALEKHCATQRYIPRLEVKNTEGGKKYITAQKEIQSEIKGHFEELYKNHDDKITFDKIESFLKTDNECQKLSEEEAEELEGKITEIELGDVLKKCKNSSTPGSSGFNYSFYKFFWKDLKTFICNSANYSFESGSLPESQRYGLISVIPKGNKNKELLSNWRPITLLNSIYKIISGAIAKRINKKISKIINVEQSGFVSGRFMGDCLRTTYDILDWAKNKKKTGLILLIDFTKAFDSISFSFISKSLTFFGFKADMIRWVKLLLNDFKAATIHAGNISAAFKILRGCRQGDPIAPILFLLAIEILCIKLRNSSNIKGFQIEDLEFLLSLYADDCTIYLEYGEDNLRNCIKLLEEFYHLSGLKIHVEKTKCIIIGNNMGVANLCEDLNLKWDKNFTLLGVEFDAPLEQMERNFDVKIEDIKSVMNNWRHRILTPLGRCCIAKTLLLPKLSHLTMVLPSIDKKNIQKIETLIYKYIWQGSEKVCRRDAKKGLDSGGLEFPDIEISYKAFKLSWFRRLAKSDSQWKKIFSILLKDCDINSVETFFSLGIADMDKLRKKLPSKFWSETISVIKPFMLELISKYPEETLKCTIWGSDIFTRNQALVTPRNFPSLPMSIRAPIDILKTTETGMNFYTYEECIGRYGLVDKDEFISFKYMINQSFRKNNVDINLIKLEQPSRPAILNLFNLSEKGCSKWTKILKTKYVTENTRKMEEKWNEKLGTLSGIDYWNNCYRMTKSIDFNNRLKWFHYQVVRGCLKTNSIVSKFKPNVGEQCTFCN